MTKPLKAISSAFLAYFWPEMAVDDNFDHARTRLVCVFSLIVGTIGLLHSIPVYYISDTLPDHGVLISNLFCLTYFTVPAIWHRTHNLRLAAFVLVAIFWVHMEYLLIADRSDIWRRELFLIGPPIILLILVGRFTARIATALMVVNFLVLSIVFDAFPVEGTLAMTAALCTLMAGLSMYFTEVNKKEVHLKELRDEAQLADAQKSEFLAKMSHEIRTPLNGLSGVLQLLDETDLTPEQKELVQIGRSSGRNLMGLINGVLDYSKIAADGITIEQIPFARDALLTTAVQSQQAAATAAGLELKVYQDPRLPSCLRGDPVRLNQVITNLLSNAIKFSKEGDIRCEMIRDGDFVRVSVTDRGIGLTEEAQTRVFNKFEQASTATSREFGGTGLGLAICKELVELLGGRIGVNSTPLLGSTFWFTFPLIEADAQESQPALPVGDAGEPSATDFAGTHVLVVEDNKTNQLIVRRFLESMQITMDVVDDGRPALQLCATRRYDLILMDIQLLDMDGVEAATILRSGPGPNQRTPIVALSANILPEQTNAYLKAGMNACLGKPYRKDELVKVMARLLDRSNTDVSAA
ncbi:ATP-binding protein [Shimia sp.]|uniref:ATP-binding protein n=1 Tax=Shimia sp. TaxID=1954381 RepID=UPI003BA956CB